MDTSSECQAEEGEAEGRYQQPWWSLRKKWGVVGARGMYGGDRGLDDLELGHGGLVAGILCGPPELASVTSCVHNFPFILKRVTEKGELAGISPKVWQLCIEHA